MIVYKYLHPDRIDVLQNTSIRFTQPMDFNDPFESFPNLSAYRDALQQRIAAKRVKRFGPDSSPAETRLLSLLTDARLYATPEMIGKHMVALCLSRTRCNPLMWAHYADSHRGFVVGFDSTSSFFAPGRGKAVDGLRPVKYSTTRATIPSEGLKNLANEEMQKLNEGCFFTKSVDWSYEEEMRILALTQAADTTMRRTDGCDICLFKFPRDAVKEIVLGMRMTEERLSAMIDVCVTHYTHSELFLSALHTDEFTVDIKPIRSENIATFKRLAGT